MPLEPRIERMKDPAVRAEMAEAAEQLATGGSIVASFGLLDRLIILTAADPANKKFEGRSVGTIAAEQGKSPIDAMLDIAIADGLDTIFIRDAGGEDHATWALRGRLWADDRTLIGASDAGAHLDLLDTFAFSTTVLQKGVREHKVIGLEQAVHLMTQRPATYFGLRDRGVIAEGNHADLVVFDAATVGRGPTYLRYDLPGTSEDYRIYADAEGVDHVIVNGIPIVRTGQHTGRLPGTALRSGTDTETVPMTAMQAAA
jgi:N-acyl-D-aspartate/D-glutamate deacylase